MLLISLGAILFLGLRSHPEAMPFEGTAAGAFKEGLQVGYNTLDLIASFIFAPMVMTHFLANGKESSSKEVFNKMIKASVIAAGLLSAMYVGLTYVASYYTPLLPAGHKPEERLSEIAILLLGSKGALVSCIAVSMACLTTAIPLVSICADYIRVDIMKDSRKDTIAPLIATLVISCMIANLGFMGIANMLSPVLKILCPGLIVLSLQNMAYKLYEVQVPRVPVFATFAFSTLAHVI
jgi:LIVCS family branched-chain amino acid:cation transporter